MSLEEIEIKIKEKVEEIINQKGIELVEFKIFRSGMQYTVRCLVDYPEGGINIDECAQINEKIFAFLDETKILGEDFIVEVNSPGLDRALHSYKDFLRAKGREVEVWYEDDKKSNYISGVLVDVNQEYLSFKKKDEIIKISLEKIKLGREKIKL